MDQAPRGFPLEAALEGLLLTCRGEERSPRTVEFYQEKLTPFLLYARSQGVTTLEACTRPLVWGFLETLTCGTETKNGYLRALRRLGRWAIEEELVERCKLATLRPLKAPQRVRQTLEARHVERFLAACRKPNKLRDQALALFLYDTGCRLGEAITLTLPRLDLENGVALVRGKGDKERLVAFDPRTAKAVWKYLQVRQAPEGVREVEASRQEVFLSRRGKPLTYNISHEFAKIAARAGLAKANPHLWRHSNATELLRNGASSAAVQRLLGHSTLVTTEVYLHLINRDAINAHRTASPVRNIRKGA